MLVQENELQNNDTCRRIIAAAAEEFAQRGFASARVRQIVNAAQVNLAAVNYYFGGKEGLYRATLLFLQRQAQEGVAVPPSNRRGRSAEQRLHRRIYAIIDRFIGADHPSPLGRILAHEAINPTRHLESLLADTMRPEVERIHALLREIAGPALPDNDVTHAALGVVGQCLLYLYARPAIDQLVPGFAGNGAGAKALARQITEFSLGGIERLKRSAALRP